MRQKPLLLDGSMGALLMARGYDAAGCYLANINNTAEITGIHKAYLAAGSDVILTNTFCVSDDIVYATKASREDIILYAIEAAREACSAFPGKRIALDLSPSPLMVNPRKAPSPERIQEYFAEQIQIALGGVDLVFFETFSSSLELAEAVKAAKEISAAMPVYATMTFGTNRKTWLGDPLGSIQRVVDAGADAVGCNCTLAPKAMAPLVEAMKALVKGKVPLIAEPNRGMPETTPEGAAIYTMPAEEFAEGVVGLFEAGADIIGGCCGSNPDCIRLIKKMVG
ncbi:MAG: homocysteine S-methyltransferase family protein [Eubacteriaceae bacterium]|nr:homocysteine S-methyltransferase family protein [Eubacteriaceae bacterium]